MATLTSTLTFTGIINGKTVTMSNTYTIEDIEDAGDGSGAQAPDSVLTGAADFPLSIPTFDYSAPQFAVVYNTSDSDRLQVEITGGTDSVLLYLDPGNFFVLNKSTDGGGFNDSGTATTSTFLDVDAIKIVSAETNGQKGPWRLFAAYKNPAS